MHPEPEGREVSTADPHLVDDRARHSGEETKGECEEQPEHVVGREHGEGDPKRRDHDHVDGADHDEISAVDLR